MGILVDDIERIRTQTDLVAIISEHVAVKKSGTRFSALCPFHTEKTPSFSINPAMGRWYCFGCHKHGDAISFLQEIEHLDFVAAVERLAARLGVTLRFDQPGHTEQRARRRILLDALDRAADWYHQRLLADAAAQHARSYLAERGITDEHIDSFQIGWAPDEWDALARHLDLPNDVLTDAGLGYLNKRNRQQDAFRARIIFPIRDVTGDVIGFGGRILPGAEGPKYRNSSDGPIYNKSTVLYGLNWAKTSAAHTGTLIICEGYTDVIGFAAADIPNSVATCGTALTEEHIRLARRFARRIVLAYDADTAGQDAADKVYTWERTHDLDIAVLRLPDGADPSSLAHQNPQALADALTNAEPYLAFRLRRLLDNADLTTVEARAKAADAAMVLIAQHPNPLVRDQYTQEVAARCHLNPDRLRASLPGASRRPRPAPTPAATASRGELSPERELLRVCVARPEAVADYIDPVLITDPLLAAALDALLDAEQLDDALAAAPPDVADLLARLAVEDCVAEPLDAVTRCVQLAATRAREALDIEIAAAADPLALLPDVQWLNQHVALLTDPASRAEGCHTLIPWLAARPGDAQPEPVVTSATEAMDRREELTAAG